MNGVRRMRGIAVAAVTAAVLLSSCGADDHGGSQTGPDRVAAGLDDCGRGWDDVIGGRQDLEIHNTTVAGEEVYLEDADSAAVFLDVENLGPDARLRSSVILGDGAYRFVCLPADGEPVKGSIVTIAGAGTVRGATPGVAPVSRTDLLPALKSYQGWVARRVPVLQRQVDRLVTDLEAGDLARARSSWLTAHRTYERLGAAYGAFGDLDTLINGLPAPGTTALTDPDLEGFHRIEALLWSDAPAGSVLPHATRLSASVATLRTAFAQARIDPVDIGLRAHEILENALQLEFTGRTDAGSHTSLATVDANLDGTRQALDPLRSILQGRYLALARTERAIDQAQRVVRDHRRPDGTWEPLTSLSTTQRQRIDAQIDETLELLAPVAAITDPRKDAS